MGGQKKFNFDYCGPLAHHYGPWAQTKKLQRTFEEMVKLFYFMTFIPKLHIFATRGKKSGYFTIFGTFQPFWRTSLPERKKTNKMKKLRLANTYLHAASVFSFSERKGFKMSKN